MGQFFTKIILQGSTQESLVDYLNTIGRETFVSPTINDFTIIFDKKSEEDSQELSTLTSQLSNQFNCSSLAVLVHDDRVLYYELYQAGKMIDEYTSNMGFHNLEFGNYPEGGDAQKLCAALDVTNATNKVRIILRTPGDEKGYFFASNRLDKLLKCLKISLFWGGSCVGGYRDIEREDIVPMTHKDPSPEIALSQLKKTVEKELELRSPLSLKEISKIEALSNSNPFFLP